MVLASNGGSSIIVGTPDWFAWLESATTFVFTCTSGKFTARKESHTRGGMYWKAYHTANGTLHRAYLGKTSELILDHLTNTAETLAAASVLIEPPAPDPRSAVSPTTPSHLLATKLNVPPPRAQLVMRPRLFERLNEGLCPSMRAYQVALPYATTRVEVPMTTLRRYPAGLLLIGLLLLSACGGNEPPTTGSGVAPTDTAAPDGAVRAATHAASSDGSPAAFKFDPAGYRKNAIEPGAQLRVSSWGDSSEQKVNSDSLARFNQVYPDVKIIYEPQPSDYGTKLLAQVKAGSPPDVFSLDVNLPYQLIPGNVLLDITPALTEVGRSKDDYFPNLTGVFLGKDGKVYGLPKDFTTMVLFYNTDMVKTPPKEGWTQDDFTAWVKENTTGSGQTQVFGFATDLVFFPYWGNFALANGAKVIDNGKCAINSTAGVATLDWLYGLYKDKYLTVSSNVGATWEGEAFAKKRAASIVVGGWVDPFLNDPSAAFGIHYDAVPLPLGKTRAPATIVGFAGWGAAAQSKYPKAAAALLLFLTSRENEDAILQTGFALPSLKGFDDDPFFKGSNTLSKISRLLYEGASYAVPGVWGGEANPKIQKALNDAGEHVFAGMQTGQQALDQACLEIDAALAAVP